MTKERIQELLHVEQIHSRHFREWAGVARDPLSKAIFSMAADKEENHVRWVNMLLELLDKEHKEGIDSGVTIQELEFWVDDEDGEGRSYERIAREVQQPFVKYVLKQMALDESTNAEMIKELLQTVKSEK